MPRKKKPQNTRRSLPRRLQGALLAVSVLVFLAGSAALVLAVQDARAYQSAANFTATDASADTDTVTGTVETPEPAESASEADEDEPVPGALDISADELVDTPEKVPAETPTKEKSASEEKSKTPQETTSKKKSDEKEAQKKTQEKAEAPKSETPKAGSETESSSSTSEPNTSSKHSYKTVKIHHTAYKKVTVYRTVQHIAVTQTDSSDENGSSAQEGCPVCGAFHDHDYVERIFDHYEEHLCEACGKKHAKAYTETKRITQ